MKILKFYANWCGQCKVLSRNFKETPIIIPIEEIDIEKDENEYLVDRYKVRNLPTTILVDEKGNTLYIWHGIVKSKLINNKIKEYESRSNTRNSLE